MFSSRTLTDPQPLGIDIDLTVDFLEDHWGEPEAGCEALHRYVDNGDPIPEICTVAVTHRFSSCCVPAGMGVCTAFAQANLQDMQPHNYCGTCNRPTLECFEVIPA